MSDVTTIESNASKERQYKAGPCYSLSLTIQSARQKADCCFFYFSFVWRSFSFEFYSKTRQNHNDGLRVDPYSLLASKRILVGRIVAVSIFTFISTVV